ncbi:hypothetical protein [Candidatus Methanoperedens nitratireducens]|uniref:Uncharacterized protein n=1 Tax=Candidatus Methanoperedens nitratireducens TaxID=1392998 RepID=A0A284VS62_9EURY|nr:hypothetical protein [Candidatus Methanoperedens nitroreducens]SNQ62048.1 hypothetical protein MNV_570001 [Candidatus Methanoperedens nitroreducens]
MACTSATAGGSGGGGGNMVSGSLVITEESESFKIKVCANNGTLRALVREAYGKYRDFYSGWVTNTCTTFATYKKDIPAGTYLVYLIDESGNVVKLPDGTQYTKFIYAGDSGSGKCVATSGQNKITVSSDAAGVKFVSCSDSCGAYMYVLTPKGAEFGKVDVPKGGCRTDVIEWKYFTESGEYTAILASYDFETHLFETTFKVTLPGTGKVKKELVTNLTDNEALIIAAVWATSNPSSRPTFFKKYQEGSNWVFQFEFTKTPDYAEFGAGAGLLRFIEANWKSISYLLAILGIGAIVWLWREPQTKAEEVRGKISDNTQSEIDTILSNQSLTPAQKQALIEAILRNVPGEKKETDWGGIVLPVAGLIAAAYVIGEFAKKR